MNRSPSPTFAQPFDMLTACHDRLQRTLALLERLRAHLPQHGADEQAQQAARDVMRYFDVASPQHHHDEELHVFPPLLANGDARQAALVARLLQDHRAMDAAWAPARAVLADIAAGTLDVLSPTAQAALDAFASLHADHLKAEEDTAYPTVHALLDAAAVAAMGAEMAARRGVRIPQAGDGATPSGGGSPKNDQP
ncbi:MAG: hemerythrin domain-containing protein [Ramlibacter sp.]